MNGDWGMPFCRAEWGFGHALRPGVRSPGYGKGPPPEGGLGAGLPSWWHSVRSPHLQLSPTSPSAIGKDACATPAVTGTGNSRKPAKRSDDGRPLPHRCVRADGGGGDSAAEFTLLRVKHAQTRPVQGKTTHAGILPLHGYRLRFKFQCTLHPGDPIPGLRRRTPLEGRPRSVRFGARACDCGSEELALAQDGQSARCGAGLWVNGRKIETGNV